MYNADTSRRLHPVAPEVAKRVHSNEKNTTSKSIGGFAQVFGVGIHVFSLAFLDWNSGYFFCNAINSYPVGWLTTCLGK